MEGVNHILLGIDGKVFLMAIRAQVVKTSHVVIVDVCEQQRVEATITGAKHLRAKVGTAVNEQIHATITHDGRGAQPHVARVAGMTHVALASQCRNAG
jgi:hypothetical protein